MLIAEWRRGGVAGELGIEPAGKIRSSGGIARALTQALEQSAIRI
jgi:hypothetical protein